MAVELEPLYLRFDRHEPTRRRPSPSPSSTSRRPALRVNTAQRVPFKRPMSTTRPIVAPTPKSFPSTNIISAHNDGLPINKLPSELLVHIVNLARNLDLSPGEHPSGRVASFSFVCRRFRKALLSAPCLWSTIVLQANATYRLQFAALCLTRAGLAPLELWIEDFYSAAQVVPLIAPHEDRIRHIRLRVPRDAPPALVAQTCTFNLPNLRSLDIAPSRNDESATTPLVLPSLFSAECTAQITHLALADCAPPLGAYTSISHLHLSGNVPDLVRLLRGCASSLRTLFLDRVTCEDVHTNEAPIELSVLDNLSVVATSQSAADQALFNLLVLCSQCGIHVRCFAPAHVDQSTLTLPALTAMRSLLASRTSHAEAVQLYVSEKSIRVMTFGEGRLSLSLEAPEAEPDEHEENEDASSANAVQSLLQTLPLDRMRSVWIVVEDQLPVDVVAVLSALTNVREFAALGVALASVSRALSTETHVGLIAPELETLYLQQMHDGRSALAVLRNTLEARIARGKRLRRLIVQGDRAGTGELRKLVDDLRFVDDIAMPLEPPSTPPEWKI